MSFKEFRLVYKNLRSILQRYAARLTVTVDRPACYSLDGPYSEKWKKVIFFGAVQVKKNYVSFYLEETPQEVVMSLKPLFTKEKNE